MGDRRLVVRHLVVISTTQPDLVLQGGARGPHADMKVPSPLVKNCQHFSCRIEISENGRGRGAGKVRGSY